MHHKVALIVGASGLIGSELLDLLFIGQEYDRVIVVGRRSLGVKHPKLTEYVTDLSNLEEYRAHLQVNDVFCCLGTTIKKAKTKEAMKTVDVDYPLLVAKITKELGAKQFVVVSSMNAKPDSAVWYSRMKGQLEEGLKVAGFESLHIMRPSLMLGTRSEFRLGETVSAFLMTKLSFLFVGSLSKYRAITGRAVAACMYKAAQTDQKGVKVYLSNEIAELGRKSKA